MKPISKSVQIFFFVFVPISGLIGLLVTAGFWQIIFFAAVLLPLIVGGGAVFRSKLSQ